MKIQRLKICAGNWKMNHTTIDAINFFVDFAKSNPPKKDDVKRVIFPQAFCLGSDVQAAASKVGFSLGAQNCHWEEKGAFTGELSASSLKQIDIDWALIGHSERRQYFAETEETAAKRLGRALKSELHAIFCVGETLAEREKGTTEQVIEKQLQPIWPILKEAENVLRSGSQIFSIAYEPVWAIGTGKTASPEQAEEVHLFIRGLIEKKMDSFFATNTPILYGGSVTAENSSTLVSKPNIDGVLVGGASLNSDKFSQILASLTEKR